VASASFLAELVRRMAGPGVDDVAGDDDVATVDDDGGEVVDANGSITAAVEFDKALLSGLCADKKAKAAVHSVTAPMTAAESHLADLALAGVAATCGFAELWPSSHVTTR
jgi:hypothetical protein